MSGPGGIVALVLLWSAAIYRARSLVRGSRRPENWSMWVAVTALATAATLFQPNVYGAVDRRLGVSNLAEVAGHACILVAAWQAQAILAFLVHARTDARRRVVGRAVLVALTVAAMAVFFTLAPVDRDVPQAFTSTYAEAPWIVPYWATFLFTVNVLVFGMLRLVVHYARRTNREYLRFGLQLVAVGGVFGVGYWCQWIAYRALRRNAVPPPVWLHPLGTVCAMVAILFTVVGSVYPAVGSRVRLRTPGGWWNDLRHYRQLRPLWQALTAAVPEIVLNQPPPVVIDVSFWLNRRVIEIEDGLLHLDRLGHHSATGTGESAAASEPVAKARRIRDVLANLKPSLATGIPVESRADPGADRAARLAWQLELARAFAHLPDLDHGRGRHPLASSGRG